jgi:serine/threonine-protein kinase RsbW
MNEPDVADGVWLNVPASYKYLNVVGACLGAVLERVEGIEARDIVAYNVELAVHETCANIVQHAYAGRGGRIDVNIKLEQDPWQVIVEMHDTGQPFDLGTVTKPDLNDAQVSGYGLFLVNELLDEVTYRPERGNNHWRLVKKLSGNRLPDQSA